MKPQNPSSLIFIFIFISFTLLLSHTTADHEKQSSIIFATMGRSNYAFDIYTRPILDPLRSTHGAGAGAGELRITDGHSVNFNGHFPSLDSSSSSSILSLTSGSEPPPIHVVYVTERNGSSYIYLDALYFHSPDRTGTRSLLEDADPSRREVPLRVQIPLIGNKQSDGRISMKDKPSLVGDNLIYISTHEDSEVARASWAAVYSTQIQTGLTRRLTPYGVADFSPSVSPSGIWTAVASTEKNGWTGEVQELNTDIYVFLTHDGSGRVKVVDHGGWPSWADDSTLYFHRVCKDGWWSIFRAIIPKTEPISVNSVIIERVTEPGLHAFTPAASIANKSFIAVATRRPGSDFRHIELFNVDTKAFTEITRPVSPKTHHFNPFISPDSKRIGYHRCRGGGGGGSKQLWLENIQNRVPEISLFRVDGSFPSFSPDGNRIAYVNFPGVYVVNRDGSGLRQVYTGMAFSTAWDPIRRGVVYTSVGPTFAGESTTVDVISINVDDDDDENPSYKKLTTGGENNAFPSPSPDGKFVVFRSGRSGHKNLYIMDAVDGENGGLHGLTSGEWTDTMCNWSPDGNWIAFASDRENPGSGSFELYMIHPNGTGIRKVVQSGSAGRANHPWFSPDGKSIVFTSDYAAVSAEPISNAHHYQPYGDIFTIRSDGSELRRLTHNSYEDGTPTWGPTYMRPVDVEWPNYAEKCSFEDCHWLKITAPKHGLKFADLSSNKTECGR